MIGNPNQQHFQDQPQSYNNTNYKVNYYNNPNSINLNEEFHKLTIRKMQYDGFMLDYQNKCKMVTEKGKILVAINRNWAEEIKQERNISLNNSLSQEEFDSLHEAIVLKLKVNIENGQRGAIYSIKNTNDKWFLTIKCKTTEIARSMVKNRSELRGSGSCNWIFPGPKPIKSALDRLVKTNIISSWHLAVNSAQVILTAVKMGRRVFAPIKSFTDITGILANIHTMDKFIELIESKDDLFHSEISIEHYTDKMLNNP